MNNSFLECCEYFAKYFTMMPACHFWIAGGALRDFFLYGKVQENTDIDMFFPNMSHFNIAYKILKKQYKVAYDNDNTVRMENKQDKIDLIKIFWADPRECIMRFDFTCCACAVRGREIYNHEAFFVDLARKRICVNNIPDTRKILTRIEKYIGKGFSISKSEVEKIERYVIENNLIKKNSKPEELVTNTPLINENMAMLQPLIELLPPVQRFREMSQDEYRALREREQERRERERIAQAVSITQSASLVPPETEIPVRNNRTYYNSLDRLANRATTLTGLTNEPVYPISIETTASLNGGTRTVENFCSANGDTIVVERDEAGNEFITTTNHLNGLSDIRYQNIRGGEISISPPVPNATTVRDRPEPNNPPENRNFPAPNIRRNRQATAIRPRRRANLEDYITDYVTRNPITSSERDRRNTTETSTRNNTSDNENLDELF